MADDVDATNERVEVQDAMQVAEVRRKAAAIPKGEPGECFYCGEEFARVIYVTDPKTECDVLSCGRCRDRRGIA